MTITFYSYTMEIYQALLFIFIAVYGIMLGLRNTYIRIMCVLTRDTILQNSSGKLLDMLWYISIFVIIGLKF